MRTEAVANPDLLRRWEMLTDMTGRQVIDGQQPITPVDPTLAGFDALVQQIHHHSHHDDPTDRVVNAGMAATSR